MNKRYLTSLLILISIIGGCKTGISQQNNDGARDYRVTALERRLFPQYSTCGKCGRPWNCCGMHNVMYSEKEGMFALCKECWDESSTQERQMYYAKVYREQVRQGMKDDHLKILLQAVANDSTRSH